MRYPVSSLAMVLGKSEAATLRGSNVGGGTARLYRAEGMSFDVAERMAEKAGLSALFVWPEMASEQIERMSKTCAADDCDELFVPSISTRRFCSQRCQQRVQMRRYRATPAGREGQRAQNRRYYEECRTYLIAVQAAYYRDNAEVERARRRADHEHRADEINARRRARYQEDAERHRRLAMERYWSDPEKARARKRAFDARKRAA